MSGRPDLALTAAERAAFLREVATAGEAVAFAVAGPDGYPVVGLAAVEVTADASALRFTDPVPADGVALCAIVERGATYDDITAVVARGVPVAGVLALDDTVTFAFAKATPR